jgi:hypothetical protein
METSIFSNKDKIPDANMLRLALGEMFDVWTEIRDYVFLVYPKAVEEWYSPGQKHGWSFRIKDKKRAIIYLLPREKYFMVAFVLGEKSTNEAMESEIDKNIKGIIQSARVYAEGRGFRLEVRSKSIVGDIKKLVDIKLR